MVSVVTIAYVRQETDSSCGIAAVAMVCGISFKDAALKIGKCGQTSTKDLIDGIRACHIKCSAKLTRIKTYEEIFGTCILKVVWNAKREGIKRKDSHWVVYSDGVIFDPYFILRTAINDYPDGKITSYLRVY